MKICHISSEISPIAKVGGLADVTLGLSRELNATNCNSFVILPKYASLKTQYLDYVELIDENFIVEYNKKHYQCEVFKAKLHGVTLYLIDSKSPISYFNREQIYGYRDDITRFTFFSKAALTFLLQNHPDTQTIHIHEWHTALIAPLYRETFEQHFKAKLVLTIHNLAYQGVTGQSLLKKVGLDDSKYHEALKDPKKDDKINLLKGAIELSDYITTVSPKYAEEILEPENGKGLESVIHKNKAKICGILNGIDTDIWNSHSDQALLVNYTSDSLEKKMTDKDYLRRYLRMPIHDKPLVVCICRLVPQKGIHMIKKAIETSLNNQAQFILFGSSPIDKIQEDFNLMKVHYRNNLNVNFIFDSYNEELSHQIYAGADMLICPSIFEPCGLTQLIALQYGTVPIARKTGGLANTVFDIEHESAEYKNGFTFDPPTKKAMDETLKRAIKLFRNDPQRWREVIKVGMGMDFSWKLSAKKYLEIYQK